MPEPTPATPTLHVARWTVASGSNARSRGAVIIDAGDHHWRASAEGNGAIDALYRAVDQVRAPSWESMITRVRAAVAASPSRMRTL